MSSDIAIGVTGLSKCYHVYGTPRDRLLQILVGQRKKLYQEFWALRDVSFEIRRGEAIGIIGRNGSGKSTLLQMICGTLTPTTGEVHINARVAALLELGAGFSPDFTGRENVYMNASIMGLDKHEIETRLPDIEAFAEIGPFIDQPVKTYSSGMYLRLAFAVAVNVDADILVVDEALAVGDEAFQRKCYAKIDAFKKDGGTIVLVSHAAQTVVELCDRAILLDGGEQLLAGEPKAVVAKYHKLLYASEEEATTLREAYKCSAEEKQEGVLPVGNTGAATLDDEFDPLLVPKSTLSYESRGALIRNPCITTLDGKQVNVLVPRQEYLYQYTAEFSQAAELVGFGMLIKTVSGLEIGGATTAFGDDVIERVEGGKSIRVRFKFRCNLQEGVYFLNAGIYGVIEGERAFLHRLIDASMFRVQADGDKNRTGIVDFLIEPEITQQDHSRPGGH